MGWRRLGDARRLVRGRGGLLAAAGTGRPLVAVRRSGGDGPCRPASRRRIVQDILQLAPGQDVDGLAGGPEAVLRRGGCERARRHRRVISSRSVRRRRWTCSASTSVARTDGNPFLAYYTRHRILPGKDRLFFFNVIAGAAVGDNRPYDAWVRLVGPGELVSARRLDLSGWRLRPAFEPRLRRARRLRPSPRSSTVRGPSTDGLPSPATVAEFLRSPRGFLAPPPPSHRRSSGD